jgi:NAD-dependent histone deacetylase SIR2
MEALATPTPGQKGPKKIKVLQHAANVTGKDLFSNSILREESSKAVFYQYMGMFYNKVRHLSPSPTHSFFRTLFDEGTLIRCYTQNIDNLEARVGLITDVGDGVQNVQLGLSDPCAVVQLHGSASALRCSQPVCRYTSSWTDEVLTEALAGNACVCPECEETNRERHRRGLRKRTVGELRPDVLLYDERSAPSRENDIDSCLKRDMAEKVDALLIIGTSMTIPGLRTLVRNFAGQVHRRRGRVICVNPLSPSASTWSDVIDDCVTMESDRFVTVVTEASRKGGYEDDVESQHRADHQGAVEGVQNSIDSAEEVFPPHSASEVRWIAAMDAFLRDEKEGGRRP